jgi:hypothetical protein
MNVIAQRSSYVSVGAARCCCPQVSPIRAACGRMFIRGSNKWSKAQQLDALEAEYRCAFRIFATYSFVVTYFVFYLNSFISTLQCRRCTTGGVTASASQPATVLVGVLDECVNTYAAGMQVYPPSAAAIATLHVSCVGYLTDRWQEPSRFFSKLCVTLGKLVRQDVLCRTARWGRCMGETAVRQGRLIGVWGAGGAGGIPTCMLSGLAGRVQPCRGHSSSGGAQATACWPTYLFPCVGRGWVCAGQLGAAFSGV